MRRWKSVSVAAFLAVAVLTFAAVGPVQAQSCCTVRGNVDCDPDGIVDIADLSRLIDYSFISFIPLCCDSAANIDGDPEGIIDIADLSMLIDYMFISFQPLSPCGSSSAMSASARMSALNAVTHVSDSLSGDPAHNQKLLAYLQSRPEFEDAGITNSPTGVWARFTDGVVLMFSSNRPGATVPEYTPPDSFPNVPTEKISTSTSRHIVTTAANPSGTVPGLPMGSSVSMLNTLGKSFSPITGVLGSWLSAQGYVVANKDETVTGLRNVGGDGVFFFSTHGGTGFARGPVEVYSLWTSEIVDTNNLKPYLADLLAGRLCLQEAVLNIDAFGDTIQQVHYGITSKFISYYWKDFANQSMVYIDACGSDGPAAQPLKSAIMAKKASVYFGWSHSVYSDASNVVAKFMFDRLLGANIAPPLEDPKQRPFDYEDVYAGLANRGLHRHPTPDTTYSYTTFQYTPGVGYFGLLCPSIREFQIDEQNDKIHIFGEFGDDPGAEMRQVTVGGEELPVDIWSPLMIVATIPNSGAGSAGPLLVESRAPVDGNLVPLIYRQSNVVNISEWKGQFRYTVVDAGALHSAITMNVHLRADLQPYRLLPHEQPVDTTAYFYGAEDSYGNVSAWGTLVEHITEDATVTQEWSGYRNLPGLWDFSDPLSSFGIGGNVNASGHWMKLDLSPYMGDAYTQTITISGTGGGSYSSTAPAVIYVDLYDEASSYEIDLTLDNNWNIVAGAKAVTIPTSSSFLVGCCTDYRLEWDQIPISYPPDLTAAQAPPRPPDSLMNINSLQK